MRNSVLSVMVCLLLVSGALSAQNLIVNSGFENTELTSGGWPSSYEDWGGDYSAIVSATDGITPYEGNQMLQFNSTGFGSGGSARASQQIQLINVSQYSELITSGNATANASIFFNRINLDSQTDTEFGLQILAYDGSISTFYDRWDTYTYDSCLTYNDVRYYSDNNINTWEQVNNQLILPTNTTFLAVHIFAIEDIFNDFGSSEFDGHFADSAYLEIVPEPATLMILGIGAIALRKRK